MAIDLVREIKNSMESVIQSTLGSGYKKLAYVENVEANNYFGNSERYGVRVLSGNEVPGVTKNIHITQTFEVVLTKAYLVSNIDETEKVDKSLDNIENILDVYKDLVNTKAGVPLKVLNITNLVLEEPEFLAESKVAVQRATIDITYRFSLI
jgi:hypothetical protein